MSLFFIKTLNRKEVLKWLKFFFLLIFIPSAQNCQQAPHHPGHHSDPNEHQKSTANGFYQAVYSVGMTLFPVFTGNIAAAACGMTGAYMVLGGIALLAVVVSFVGTRRIK